jgi:hypothetical protein
VVAHEFSHILNGDMRLNIRLIGLISGIMVLSVIGRVMMFTGGRRSSRSGGGDSRGGNMMLALGLFVLGLVGAFFGRLIQAAVSRQREYLADASAVQFTRNPDGIAGALKKIGGLKEGSRITNPRAAEFGHMFIANAFAGRGLFGLLATHPPMVARIRALDPQFDGQFPEVVQVAIDRQEAESSRPGGGPPRFPGLAQVPLPILGFADGAAARVGHIDAEEVSQAHALYASIPDPIRVATQEPFSARALIYALLLDPRAELRDLQLAQVKANATPTDFAETVKLAAPVQALEDRLRLPLLDLAMPALRQMSPGQHKTFRNQVEALVNADQRLSLFEYTLRCVLHRHLDAQFLPQRPMGPLQSSAQELAAPMAKVLSLLAWEGQPEPEQAARAFDTGMRSYIGGDHTYRLPPLREDCSLAEFHTALQTLHQSVPAIKRRIVVACAACIGANQQVSVREAELLRAICDTLDCPLPPLIME